ncbi:MAG: MFS transporter, partial [Actinobacteria bacterium]|nr:MFS transporter [Actinomycetota bacterium]
VFGLWAGAVVDRLDKRMLLLTTQVVAAAQSAAYAVLAFAGSPPLGAIYAVALVGGFVVAIDTTARRAFVVELVDEEHVANAVSLNSAMMTSSRVFGPVIAGVLISTVGYAWCFTLDALSYVGPVVALLVMRTSEIRRAPVVSRTQGQIRDAFRYVGGLPNLWLPIAMTAIIGTFTLNFQVVFPLLVTRTFDGTDAAFTLLFSVLSVGSVLGALWMARHTTLRLAQTVHTATLLGVATLLLAAAPDLPVAFPLALLMGLGMTAFITSSTANLQLTADAEKRGRVLALQSVVLIGSTPIGGPIVGAIVEAWGPRAGLVVGGIACLGATGFGYWVMRRHRDLPTSIELGVDGTSGP